MKRKTFDSLRVAYDICDKEDRSIEYTIQFMQDMVGVDIDCVMNWLCKNRDKTNKTEGNE